MIGVSLSRYPSHSSDAVIVIMSGFAEKLLICWCIIILFGFNPCLVMSPNDLYEAPLMHNTEDALILDACFKTRDTLFIFSIKKLNPIIINL
jgi:hypothetical protein